jgi:hypothetical protein
MYPSSALDFPLVSFHGGIFPVLGGDFFQGCFFVGIFFECDFFCGGFIWGPFIVRLTYSSLQ